VAFDRSNGSDCLVLMIVHFLEVSVWAPTYLFANATPVVATCILRS
jgi:hypothetical protein